MQPLIFGIFGLIIGSFLNVLILRWGKRGLGGRSSCPRCNRTLAWFDMVPVLSWLALRGRCRTCGARISVQYPLVEAATGILFAIIGASSLPLVGMMLSCAMTSLLVAITVYDLYHTIIPDAWVLAFAILALITQASLAPAALSWMTLASGPLAALPLFALWFISRGAWMGFGDVKLALGIGWLLGPLPGVGAIFLAFVIGALVSLPLVFFTSERWRTFKARHVRWGKVAAGKKTGFTMKSEVPFGPFLVASTFIIWFCLLFNITLPLMAIYGV